MKYKSPIILGVICVVYGFMYNKPSQDSKLKCDRCNSSYFTVSERTSKFIGSDNNRTMKSGYFYKCAKCGILSDCIVNK